jgi:uncharacterized protein YcfL
MNIYKLKYIIALNLVAVCLALNGCKSTPSIEDMTTRMRDTDEVKIVDMRSIMVNNTIKVDVSIDVKSTKKNISYRFKWLDKNKFQVYGDEVWKPLTIGSGQSGIIQGIAPGPAAVEFKFELSSD